jgi:hypothetical protein
MHLDARGHPLHSRALGITMRQRGDGKLDLDSYILDLRKRGFVPVGADLQGSGIIHHMCLRGVIEPATLVLESIAAEQPSVAFEPSALTGGECCRDPIDRIASLAGAGLDADYGRRLTATIGGSLGCSHLLTLAHLVGSTVPWALARDRELQGTVPARRPGERVFRRDLIIDGAETDGRTLEACVQLTDLHFAPAPAVTSPMQRFAAELEVRMRLEIDLNTFTLARVTAGRRWRRLADLERARWEDLHDVLQPLAGMPMLHGAIPELRRRWGDQPESRPVFDALLMIAPALIQCTAALSEAWPMQAKDSESLVGMSGYPDSCYMWRRTGALHRARRPDDPVPRM